MIDTHKAIIELVECNFTQQQAEGVIHIIQQNNQIAYRDLATKTDMEIIKNDLVHIRESVSFLKWFMATGFGLLALLITLIKL